MRSVYENIEMIRAAKGVKKRAVAQYLGVSEMKCNRMLWGETQIPADMVKGFASFLGITDINVIYDDRLTDSVIEQTKVRVC